MRKKIRAALLSVITFAALCLMAAETAYASGPHHHVSAKAVLIPLGICALLELVVLALFRQPRRRGNSRRQPSSPYGYNYLGQ